MFVNTDYFFECSDIIFWVYRKDNEVRYLSSSKNHKGNEWLMRTYLDCTSRGFVDLAQ